MLCEPEREPTHYCWQEAVTTGGKGQLITADDPYVTSRRHLHSLALLRLLPPSVSQAQVRPRHQPTVLLLGSCFWQRRSARTSNSNNKQHLKPPFHFIETIFKIYQTELLPVVRHPKPAGRRAVNCNIAIKTNCPNSNSGDMLEIF